MCLACGEHLTGTEPRIYTEWRAEAGCLWGELLTGTEPRIYVVGVM
jgi:hypothetical protein